MNYVLSDHAKEELKKPGRQQIKSEWIERALSYPDHSDEDSRTNTLRVWKRIPEYGNRALRVVYSPDTQPVFVVTVFFDRGFKR